jgi:Domain of unknown function (DUF4410)
MRPVADPAGLSPASRFAGECGAVAARNPQDEQHNLLAVKADEAVPEGALLIEGKFLTIDPGSRAKRYFAGFGAGKSSVKVVGSVKDATGRTLATFEQRRIGTMGMGGGDSLGKLMSDSRSIGEDIGKFPAKWARGEALD